MTQPEHPVTTDALLLVDLQVDYFSDDELARCRDDLVAHTDDLVAAARGAGVRVVVVRTEHAHDRSTWALSMRDDDSGMVLAGTEGAELLPELLPELPGRDDEVAHVVKTRDSAFHRTDLAERLERWGIEVVVLVGVSTESCISATASDAYAHDLRAVVVRDAVASVHPERQERALEELELQYRQPARWAADVVVDWEAGRSTHPLLQRGH